MNPFSAVATWLQTYALAIVSVIALAGWGSVGVQSYRLATTETSLANEKTGRAEDRLQAETTARLTEAKFRQEEARTRAATQKAIDEANQIAERERNDRAIADAAAGRLQQRLDAYVAAARKAAQAASASDGSQATEGPTGVLALVLSRCVERVRLLASVADERGRAGSTCERISDEVRAEED